MSGDLVKAFDASGVPTFGRFAIVSGVSLVSGHLLLFGLHVGAEVPPVAANVASTIANTTLVWLANRAWVWKAGASLGLQRELTTFALFAVLGLALSSTTVSLTAKFIGEGLWVNAANFLAFGLLWIARFAALNRFVYD